MAKLKNVDVFLKKIDEFVKPIGWERTGNTTTVQSETGDEITVKISFFLKNPAAANNGQQTLG